MNLTILIALAILLILSGFFSGIEIALFSLGKVKTATLVKQKKKNAKVVQYLKRNPRKLLTTILIGNNVVNIGASALATALAINAFGSIGTGIATGVMTLLILIFGEIIPKAFATKYAEAYSLKFAWLIKILMFILWPIVWVLDKFTGLIMGFGKSKGEPTVTEEEVKTMAEMSVKEGGLEQEEQELIEKVFQFNDITAEDVMTPRTQMESLPCDMRIKEALHIIAKSPFSRIPLYKKDRDHIVGIVHVKDVLATLDKKKTGTKLQTLARKPLFIPETQIINELFKMFQEKKIHMAIVVDEFGGTSGIVTMEDLIEELMGEIVDESDINEELIMRLSKNEIKVHGNTEIKEINDFFNVRIPGKGTDTINALMHKKLKKMPRKGESLEIGNVKIIVDKTSRRKIERVIIIKEDLENVDQKTKIPISKK